MYIVLHRELQKRSQVTLDIAASEAQAGRKIGVRPDSAIGAKRGHDVVPVRSDRSRKLGQRVCGADGSCQEEVDGNLCEFGTFECHDEVFGRKVFQPFTMARVEIALTAHYSDDVAFGLESPLESITKHQRLNLIGQVVVLACKATSGAGLNLGHEHHGDSAAVQHMSKL